MVVVQVPTGISACQIDFPEFQLNGKGRPVLDSAGAPVPFGARSCVGALHIRPGSTKSITLPELEYIKKNHAGLKLRVLVADVQAPVVTVVPPAEPPQAKLRKGNAEPAS